MGGTESSSKYSWIKSPVEAHLWFTEDAIKVGERKRRKETVRSDRLMSVSLYTS